MNVRISWVGCIEILNIGLHPGDIDIVAAMGDSITAGTGANALTLFESLFIENRGVSFSIGGLLTYTQNGYEWQTVK